MASYRLETNRCGAGNQLAGEKDKADAARDGVSSQW